MTEQPKQNIEPREITDEMKESYLDYAISVIVSPRSAGCPRRAETGSPPDSLRYDGRRVKKRR